MPLFCCSFEGRAKVEENTEGIGEADAEEDEDQPPFEAFAWPWPRPRAFSDERLAGLRRDRSSSGPVLLVTEPSLLVTEPSLRPPNTCPRAASGLPLRLSTGARGGPLPGLGVGGRGPRDSNGEGGGGAVAYERYGGGGESFVASLHTRGRVRGGVQETSSGVSYSECDGSDKKSCSGVIQLR